MAKTNTLFWVYLCEVDFSNLIIIHIHNRAQNTFEIKILVIYDTHVKVCVFLLENAGMSTLNWTKIIRVAV